MARMKFNRRLILAKTETTYGADSTPTGSLNAILTRNLEISPLEGEVLQRELDKANFGADAGDLVGQFVSITFQVEVAGAGAAGDVPAWAPLMLAAGHEQDQDDPTTPTEITFSPIDDDTNSVTFYFHGDKVRHRVVGARGTVTLVTGKRQYSYWQFEYTGLILDIAAGTMPTGDTSAFVKPVPCRAATVAFSLFGGTRAIHNFTLNGGQTVSFYEASENGSLEQEDRESSFEALIELPEVGDWDVYAAIKDGTVGALQYVHGTTSGNIVQVDAGEVQMTNSPSRSSENGIVALTVGGPVITSDTSATTTGYLITVK